MMSNLWFRIFRNSKHCLFWLLSGRYRKMSSALTLGLTLHKLPTVYLGGIRGDLILKRLYEKNRAGVIQNPISDDDILTAMEELQDEHCRQEELRSARTQHRGSRTSTMSGGTSDGV